MSLLGFYQIRELRLQWLGTAFGQGSGRKLSGREKVNIFKIYDNSKQLYKPVINAY